MFDIALMAADAPSKKVLSSKLNRVVVNVPFPTSLV